jgi:hypothetical protein
VLRNALEFFSVNSGQRFSDLTSTLVPLPCSLHNLVQTPAGAPPENFFRKRRVSH